MNSLLKKIFLMLVASWAVPAEAQWINTGSGSGSSNWKLDSTYSASQTQLVNDQLGFLLALSNTSDNTLNQINATAYSSDGSQGLGYGSSAASLIGVVATGAGANTAGSSGPGIAFNSSTGGTANFNGSASVGGGAQLIGVWRGKQGSDGPFAISGPSSVISIISNGSVGAGSTDLSSQSAQSAGSSGSVNASITGGTLNIEGFTWGDEVGSNVAWQPTGSALSVYSNGGAATAYLPRQNPPKPLVGTGGNANNVTVSNQANISIGTSTSPTQGQ